MVHHGRECELRLLIMCPAYNESDKIDQVVHEALAVLPTADVLVVDDGSADYTALAAERAGAMVLRLPFNLGIGGAVRTGLSYAADQGYDVVARLDGDGQHDPRYIASALASIDSGKADMVVGSRYLGTAEGYRASGLRGIGVAYFGRLVSLLTGQRFTDTTSGQWVLNQRSVSYLSRNLPSDYPEIEALVLMCRRGMTVAEQSVRMRARDVGESSITPLKSLYYAAKVTLALLIGQLANVPVELPAPPPRARALPLADRVTRVGGEPR